MVFVAAGSVRPGGPPPRRPPCTTSDRAVDCHPVDDQVAEIGGRAVDEPNPGVDGRRILKAHVCGDPRLPEPTEGSHRGGTGVTVEDTPVSLASRRRPPAHAARDHGRPVGRNAVTMAIPFTPLCYVMLGGELSRCHGTGVPARRDRTVA